MNTRNGSHQPGHVYATDQGSEPIAKGDGWQICSEADRVRIYFTRKPAPELRAIVKNYGFRWNRKAQAWQRPHTASAVFAARQTAAALTQEATQ